MSISGYLLKGRISAASSGSFYQLCCTFICAFIISYISSKNEQIAWIIVGINALSALSTICGVSVSLMPNSQ